MMIIDDRPRGGGGNRELLYETGPVEVKRARLIFDTRGVSSPGTATQSFLDATKRLGVKDSSAAGRAVTIRPRL
jgi:hypothetical protein